MQSFYQKYINRLKECGLYDESNILFVTKWNATIGASFITTFGDDLFITPYGYGDCTKRTSKINRNEIVNIDIKESFWTGTKIKFILKNGSTLKYSIVNKSWIDSAYRLKEWVNSK